MSGAILAIDTSGSFCSVAVRTPDGSVVERNSSGDGDHFERLPSLVSDVCAGAGMSLRDLAAIRIGLGPGSFTGLRIGLSFAKGLASSCAIPLRGVGSFHAAAAEVLWRDEAVKTVGVISDARRDEVFVAAFSRSTDPGTAAGEVQVISEPQIVPITALGSAPWSGVNVWYSTLRDFSLTGIELRETPSLARGMLLGKPEIGVFSLSDIAALEPSYLRAVAAKTIAERQQGA